MRIKVRIRLIKMAASLRRTHVIRVECQRLRSTLRSTPERLTGTCKRVLRKTEQQLTNAVVVLFLELQASPDDTLLKGQRLVGNEIRDELLKLFLNMTRVLECAFQVVGLCEVRVHRLSRGDKEVVEFLSCPLESY